MDFHPFSLSFPYRWMTTEVTRVSQFYILEPPSPHLDQAFKTSYILYKSYMVSLIDMLLNLTYVFTFDFKYIKRAS